MDYYEKYCYLNIGTYKTQVAGWNFAGWEFCRLEFCRLSGTLQFDDANLT